MYERPDKRGYQDSKTGSSAPLLISWRNLPSKR